MSAYSEWRSRYEARGGMMLPQIALDRLVTEKLIDVKRMLEYRDGVNVSYADTIRHIITEYDCKGLK